LQRFVTVHVSEPHSIVLNTHVFRMLSFVSRVCLRRYGASSIMGSRLWLFGITWRHQSHDHSTRGVLCDFLRVVHCNHASILHRTIQHNTIFV